MGILSGTDTSFSSDDKNISNLTSMYSIIIIISLCIYIDTHTKIKNIMLILKKENRKQI